MRWPDLFFKSRKPKVPSDLTRLSIPSTKYPPAGDEQDSREADQPNGAVSQVAVKDAPVGVESPRITETASDSKPPNPVFAPKSTGKPPAPETNVLVTKIDPPEAAPEDAASAVLSAKGSLRRRAKLKDVARILPESTSPMAPVVPTSPVLAPFSSPMVDELEVDPSKDSEPDLKAAPGSIRETGTPAAKQTVPPSEINAVKSAPPEAAKEEIPPTVVPPAFPVAVETGSVIDREPKPLPETAPTAIEAKPVVVEISKLKEEASAFKHEPAPTSTPPKEQVASSADAPPSSWSGDHKPDLSPVIVEDGKNLEGRERREFILANGERILGHVLSETPQSIYLDHGTLGVLTLPRSQIAKKPIEVILINGDRVVGDLIAETPECLYIRHASLGMLTVPHNQRSTRVVEAILKDGDRILGEVLAETEDFTVIRSATLGTVAVQHQQVAMLNRKAEQMELRLLGAPPETAAVEDKSKT